MVQLKAAEWVSTLLRSFSPHVPVRDEQPSLFLRRDPQSMLAFLGEGHRFSDIVLGVGSDPASEFCARADALWTLARQAFKKGHLSLTALVRSSAR
jgi:hypothetical protein